MLYGYSRPYADGISTESRLGSGLTCSVVLRYSAFIVNTSVRHNWLPSTYASLKKKKKKARPLFSKMHFCTHQRTWLLHEGRSDRLTNNSSGCAALVSQAQGQLPPLMSVTSNLPPLHFRSLTLTGELGVWKMARFHPDCKGLQLVECLAKPSTTDIVDRHFI